MNLVEAALIGIGIGFLSGLLGKGGSAIATPLLHAVGFPAIVAVASPLPATIPSTLAASYAYAQARLINWRVVRWSIGCGVPATVVGALVTRWVGGESLVITTDIVLICLGIKLLIDNRRAMHTERKPPRETRAMLATVAVIVGFTAGLLANSGGFLLAPLYATVLRLPIKMALASSLAVATVLAIPGTAVHAALGHIDWVLVAVLASTSVPLSFLGARVALRTDPARLEGIYGIALVVLGTVFLILH